MADEPTTVTTDTSGLDATTDAANKASEALGVMNSVGALSKNVFNDFQNRMQSVGISLKTNSELTENQATAFGVLSAAVLGARKSFDQLAGIDTSALSTFKGQWEDLANLAKNSPFGQTVIDGMKSVMRNAGISEAEIAKAAEGGVESLSKLGAAFMESADNGLRLQNAMVQLAAKTGNLDNLLRAAGPGLEDINSLLAQQQDVLNQTAAATKLNAETVEKYYAQLGAIPKALDATISSGEAAGESINMLTATINFAKGAGRSFETVLDDLKTAYKEYGLSGEDALKFTARISELSNKFGVELTDVQDSLRSTAGLFKLFGKEAEGAAKMVNNYLGELQKTGISGKTAMEVINGMTQGIKGMTLAQKSFLSSQTGGAGGLQGAFQIEKMLREGKLDEVMEKARQQMQKQFGRIVSVDDAASSPQAAAQLTKQMMILQQGPLGRFAKDDQSAIKILEAFKARESGGAVQDLSKSIVQDTMKTGVDLQEKSVTELTRIRELLQGTQNAANIANLGTLQHAMTAGVGSPINSPTGDYNSAMRDSLKESRRQAGVLSGDATRLLGSGTNPLGTMGAGLINGYKDLAAEMGPAITGPANKIKDMLRSGQEDQAKEMYKQYMADREQRKAELANAPGAAGVAGLQQVNQESEMMKSLFPGLSGISQTNVSSAVNRAVNRTAPAGGATATAPGAAHANHGPLTGEFTVQVEGYCLSCGDKMKNQQQRKSVSVGSSIDK